MAILCYAEMPSYVVCVATVTLFFQFSLHPFTPLSRRHCVSLLFFTLFFSAVVVTFCAAYYGRKRENFENRRRDWVFLPVVSPVHPAGRSASFIMASSIIPREACAPGLQLMPRVRLAPRRDADILPLSSFLSSGHHAWELSKRD